MSTLQVYLSSLTQGILKVSRQWQSYWHPSDAQQQTDLFGPPCKRETEARKLCKTQDEMSDVWTFGNYLLLTTEK